ncbi:MAG: PKD domain-containing protein [Bacteroidota bacterium]
MFFVKLARVICLWVCLIFLWQEAQAQCGSQIMEPGFSFITSSRGCAPFDLQIQTLYLASTPGTQYFVNWGDGSPEEVYVQTAPYPNGPIIQHNYLNASTDCGYEITIEVDNACNPRGSVVLNPIQVIVWTNDVPAIDPVEFRVCQGFAANVQFTDNSDWNCFPRADIRENNEARWIQWIYGTGPGGVRIPGISVDGVMPGAFPYLNPAPNTNPIYPVNAPGSVSLGIAVPVTAPADIGRQFEITFKNWNQCNPYDNDLLDGNAFNPVNGDLVNGDNPPMTTTGRIVIVPSPVPDYLTRAGNAAGPVQRIFCIGDDIYFDNETPPIGGANFVYTWEFFDNATGTGAPLATSNDENPTFAYTTSSGSKLIRLTVRDANAAGNCEAVFEDTVLISPTLVAQIQVTDLADNPITPEFCQQANPPLTNFDVRFRDISTGLATPDSRWKWEFYDENDVLFREEPGAGAFANTTIGPFDEVFVNPGNYKVKLIIKDDITDCESVDSVFVRVYENPTPDFNASRVCAGDSTAFEDLSMLNAINGESIVSWEWDFNYDGVTFNKDPAFDNQVDFNHLLGPAGSYDVALRVTTDQNMCFGMIVKTVEVSPLPLADFSPDVTEGCSILEVNFTNTVAAGQIGMISQYVWEIDANDGNGFVVDSIQMATQTNFIKRFENITSADRIFNVRLRAITVDNCEFVSAAIPITVYPGPTSGFAALNYHPFDDNCSPLTVNFEADPQTQAFNPDTYVWRIADQNGLIYQENSGTTPNFQYTFTNNQQGFQDFSVTLTTTLPTTCFSDSTRIIRVNPVPSSEFEIDTLAYDCELMSLRLAATQQGLQAYNWEVLINGIVTFTSQDPSFDYQIDRPAVGLPNKDVSFRLSTLNFANCPSVITEQSLVVPVRDDINTSFTVDPIEQTLPDATVTITNNTNPGPWSYLWDFGDGTQSTDPNVAEHTYATFGSYTITLTVTQGACIETYVETVVINPIPPIVDFDYRPASGCAPLTVEFINLSQFASEDSYVWNFGRNQGTSNAENPTYTYFEPGTYTVSLAATNILGDTVREVKEQIIEVFEVPNADFNVKPFLVYAPDGPLYTNNTSFNATLFQWDFGDGTTSTEIEPVHFYKEEGIYDITLIASNDFGCMDTIRKESLVRVEKGGDVLVPNAFSPNLSGPLDGESAGQIGGVNDVFLPRMRGVVNFEMQIFNRWGEMLFRTESTTRGWDGYYKGQLCPQDVYVYKISVEFENGRRDVRVGDVNLIR